MKLKIQNLMSNDKKKLKINLKKTSKNWSQIRLIFQLYDQSREFGLSNWRYINPKKSWKKIQIIQN